MKVYLIIPFFKLNVFWCFVVLFGISNHVLAQSEWVYRGANNKLVYKTDSKGNRIMDFSSAGYMGGDAVIPIVPAKDTLFPSGGDDLSAIQGAIDQLAAMPLLNGFRGAVILTAGTFQTSGTININVNGVVVRGSGSGSTIIKATTDVNPVFLMSGSDAYIKSDKVDISGILLPSGAMSFDLSDASGFSVGDNILISKFVTEEWIAYVGMDSLFRDGKHQTWISPGTELKTDRTIVAIDGNTITLNAPVTDVFDAEHLGMPIGKVCKYTFPGRLTQCGLENLKIEAPDSKLGGAFRSVKVDKAKDCWVRDVAIKDGTGNFFVSKNVRQVTIDEVTVRHTVVRDAGAPPGDFACTGTQILFNNCAGYGIGSWAWVTHSAGSGPIVLLNFYSEQTSGIAPHMRWTTGVLADNCMLPNANAGIAFRNRGTMGSGHGWTTGWSVAWNVETPSFLVAQAPGTMNWAIGGHGSKTTANNNPDGIYDQLNTTVSPASLYMAQLRQRFPVNAPTNLVASQQYKQNDLWWTDKADTETGYIVERSVDKKRWKTLENLPANTTFYADTALESSNIFYYRVRAVNITALSVSSNIVTVNNTKLINTIADASVGNFGLSNINLGTDTVLTTLFTASGLTNMAYLKFDLALLPKELSSVKLRVKAKKENKNIVEAFFVQNDSWDEQAITWNNKPEKSTSLGRVSANEEDIFEWDILDLVNTEIEGDKILTVVLIATEMNKSLEFYSREGAADNMLLQPSLAYKSLPLMELKVLEDSYVSGGSNADTNYGSENKLAIEATQTTNNNSKEAYLKFDLSNLPANIGTCRLLLRGISDEENRYGLYEVSNDSWSENSITWNNKPDAGNLVDTASSSKIEFVEFDVTEEVKNQLGGDKILSVRIAGLYDVAGGFYSKEGAGMHENYKPVIVVEHEQKTITVGTNSLQNPKYEKDLLVYPNPANDKIFIRNMSSGTSVSIFNLNGQLMMNKVYKDCLDISSLQFGVYFLSTNDGMSTKNFRFIKLK
jgi:hypothetical protein